MKNVTVRGERGTGCTVQGERAHPSTLALESLPFSRWKARLSRVGKPAFPRVRKAAFLALGKSLSSH